MRGWDWLGRGLGPACRQDQILARGKICIDDAQNQGLRRCTSDIVGFMHADDVYGSPQVLEQVAAASSADPSGSAVCGDLQYVRRDNLNHLVRHWRATSPSAAFLQQ